MIHDNKNNKKPFIVLWGVSVSFYVRKVMVALEEKQLNFKQNEILPSILLKATSQAIPREFAKISPFGKIPAIEIDDFVLTDSAAIAGYLDREFNHGIALYPKDPESYGKALAFEHFSDQILTEVAYKKIFLEKMIKPQILNTKPEEDLIKHAIEKELSPLLDYLNQSVEKSEWMAGKEFSMADIAITTQLLALEMSGVIIDKKRWNDLNAYFKRTISRPSFHRILSS